MRFLSEHIPPVKWSFASGTVFKSGDLSREDQAYSLAIEEYMNSQFFVVLFAAT